MASSKFSFTSLFLVCIAASHPVWAASPKPPLADPTADELMITAGFLSAHPDLRFRLLGLEEYKAENFQEALGYFRRAAYYADKPSQGMVAEMLWSGQGTQKDPALAYAWMDLAAERGYKGFLGMRERYWSQLDETEQARAVAEGAVIYAEFGDEAAKPRLATVLRRERLRMTGSRVGTTGNLKIYVASADGYTQIDGSKFYDQKYWNPEKYMQWHDQLWMNPRIGTVDVGEVRQADASSGSRIDHSPPRDDTPEPQTPDKMPKLGAPPIPR